jgi:hypothetical protein
VLFLLACAFLLAGSPSLKNMKFNFLQKQASRREILRDSSTLAGSALLNAAGHSG